MGEYTITGTFNDHPVYSNGKTKWVYLDSTIDTEITTPGYYLFDEPALEIDDTEIIDITDEIADIMGVEE